MKKLKDIGGRLLLILAGLSISGGFFCLMAYFLLWIEPHKHFAFLADPKTSSEAWRLASIFGLIMAGTALVLGIVSSLFSRIKKHARFC